MHSSARFKSCSRKPQGKQPIRQGLYPDIPAGQKAGSHPPEPEDRRAVTSFRRKSRAPVNTTPAPRRADTARCRNIRGDRHKTARRSQEVCSGHLSPLEDPRGTPLRHPVTRTSEPPSGPPWTRVALALHRQAWPPELTAAFPLPESWDPTRFLPPTLPGSCSSPT